MKKYLGHLLLVCVYAVNHSAMAFVDDDKFCPYYKSDLQHLETIQMRLAVECDEEHKNEKEFCEEINGTDTYTFEELLRYNDELAAKLQTLQFLKNALGSFYKAVDKVKNIQNFALIQQKQSLQEVALQVSSLHQLNQLLKTYQEDGFFADCNSGDALERIQCACRQANNQEHPMCKVLDNRTSKASQSALFKILHVFGNFSDKVGQDRDFFQNIQHLFDDLYDLGKGTSLNLLGQSLLRKLQDYENACLSEQGSQRDKEAQLNSPVCQTVGQQIFSLYRQELQNYAQLAEEVIQQKHFVDQTQDYFRNLRLQMDGLAELEMAERKRLSLTLESQLTAYSGKSKHNPAGLYRLAQELRGLHSVEDFDVAIYKRGKKILDEMGVKIKDGKCKFDPSSPPDKSTRPLVSNTNPATMQRRIQTCLQDLGDLNLDRMISTLREKLKRTKNFLNNLRSKTAFQKLERSKRSFVYLMQHKCYRYFKKSTKRKPYTCGHVKLFSHPSIGAFIDENSKVIALLDAKQKGQDTSIEALCEGLGDEIEGLDLSSCPGHDRHKKIEKRVRNRRTKRHKQLNDAEKIPRGSVWVYDRRKGTYKRKTLYSYQKTDRNRYLKQGLLAGAGQVLSTSLQSYFGYQNSKGYYDYLALEGQRSKLYNMCYNPVGLDTLTFENFCIFGPFNNGYYPLYNSQGNPIFQFDAEQTGVEL